MINFAKYAGLLGEQSPFAVELYCSCEVDCDVFSGSGSCNFVPFCQDFLESTSSGCQVAEQMIGRGLAVDLVEGMDQVRILRGPLCSVLRGLSGPLAGHGPSRS